MTHSAEKDRGKWWIGNADADPLLKVAEIARLRDAHPVESCDLFRTVTGRCTCPTPPERTEE